jgi:glyoxylate carboligase
MSASIRCGRRSVIIRLLRAALSLPAAWEPWGSLCPLPSACNTVVCVSGDGGFQMNIQELATVQRLGLPIKMVIVDNKYLGMVRQWQQLFYQRNYAQGL